MPSKLTYEYVKSYIEGKGDTLVSLEYNSTKKGYQHQNCLLRLRLPSTGGGYKKPVTLKPIICVTCKKEFQPKRSDTKSCSLECYHTLMRSDERRKMAAINGQKGGKLSATIQCKRSKNEIYFSELCAREFEITTNEPFFDGWDADVIIHSEKTAILWNGIWHYKQIVKTQSMKQVQARDKVKTAIIEKYGYIPYVIKDMGKHNKAFVEQEFEIFKLMRIDI